MRKQRTSNLETQNAKHKTTLKTKKIEKCVHWGLGITLNLCVLNCHSVCVFLSQYLFWAVKVSLWGWRPLYTTRIRSCWQRAPSVSAMDPRLEGCSYREQTVGERVHVSNSQSVSDDPSSIHKKSTASLCNTAEHWMFFSTINTVSCYCGKHIRLNRWNQKWGVLVPAEGPRMRPSGD